MTAEAAPGVDTKTDLNTEAKPFPGSQAQWQNNGGTCHSFLFFAVKIALQEASQSMKYKYLVKAKYA